LFPAANGHTLAELWAGTRDRRKRLRRPQPENSPALARTPCGSFQQDDALLLIGIGARNPRRNINEVVRLHPVVVLKIGAVPELGSSLEHIDRGFVRFMEMRLRFRPWRHLQKVHAEGFRSGGLRRYAGKVIKTLLAVETFAATAADNLACAHTGFLAAKCAGFNHCGPGQNASQATRSQKHAKASLGEADVTAGRGPVTRI